MDWLDSPADFSAEAAGTIEAALLPDGDRPLEIRLHGRCPRCGHATEFGHPLTLVHGVNVAERADELGIDTSRGDTTIHARCRCEEAHQGRPDGEVGCNALFAVRVVWP